MGADYKGQDKAIAELSALSREAKEFLNHHIGNSLNVIIVGIEARLLDIATEAAWHIAEDLELAGIRMPRSEREGIPTEQFLAGAEEHFARQHQISQEVKE